MKILIDLHNLSSGGGLTIGFGIVEELISSNLENDYFIVVPSKRLYQFPDKKNINLIELPRYYHSYLGKLFIGEKIASFCKSNNIEKVLSLTNYAIPINIKQKLLIHWPYLVYNNSELWDKMTYFNKIKRLINKKRVLKKLKWADEIIVQTNLMKRKLELLTSKKISVIPAFHNFKSDPNTNIKQAVTNLLFPSNFYEHKNHEILLELIQEIEKRNSKLKIHITLDKNHPFIRKIKNKDCIQNIGKVTSLEIEKIYPTMDALFMPTLIETFGIPYIEAMHFNLPIFTSDRDFARDVCKVYAQYFDPTNANDILNCIENYTYSNTAKPIYKNRTETVSELLKF